MPMVVVAFLLEADFLQNTLTKQFTTQTKPLYNVLHLLILHSHTTTTITTNNFVIHLEAIISALRNHLLKIQYCFD